MKFTKDIPELLPISAPTEHDGQELALAARQREVQAEIVKLDAVMRTQFAQPKPGVAEMEQRARELVDGVEQATPAEPTAAIRLAAAQAKLAAIKRALEILGQRIATTRAQRARLLTAARLPEWTKLVRQRVQAVCKLQGLNRLSASFIGELTNGSLPGLPCQGVPLLGLGGGLQPYAPDPAKQFIDGAIAAGYVTSAEVDGWRAS